MQEFVCDINELKNLAAEWKERLHLEGWRIAVGINERDSFSDKERVGESAFRQVSQEASISIRSHDDWDNPVFPQDMEQILVHELLHLIFQPFEPSGEQKCEHMLWHRTIDSMARLLVSLKREGQ